MDTRERKKGKKRKKIHVTLNNTQTMNTFLPKRYHRHRRRRRRPSYCSGGGGTRIRRFCRYLVVSASSTEGHCALDRVAYARNKKHSEGNKDSEDWRIWRSLRSRDRAHAVRRDCAGPGPDFFSCAPIWGLKWIQNRSLFAIFLIAGICLKFV